MEEVRRKEEEAFLKYSSDSSRWEGFPAEPVVPVPRRYNRWRWANGSKTTRFPPGRNYRLSPAGTTAEKTWNVNVLLRVWHELTGSGPVEPAVLPL